MENSTQFESLVLGADATATADNQFVIGSETKEAGQITTEPDGSEVWNVVINGVERKILLA